MESVSHEVTFALEDGSGILTLNRPDKRNALRNAGVEVVYVHFSDAKEIVQSAIEEDVDLIGITSSLGEHLLVSPLSLEELNKVKVNVPVILGGVIPNIDVPKLLDIGGRRVFGPGSVPQEVVSFVSQIV